MTEYKRYDISITGKTGSINGSDHVKAAIERLIRNLYNHCDGIEIEVTEEDNE